ncbi:MAG: type II toxin-antitoxin system RelE/ParE family toxin [Chloroflexi bacterium]|nr:type II toxin-antitoxin system RelE/ParE family toxin [Chloroflexota bacterium]
MVQVAWTARARRDMREIHDYIADDSKSNAESMIRRSHVAIERLTLFPMSGRLVPELDDPQYREVIVDPYRVIYRHESGDTSVEIMRVVHGRRQLPPVDS